MEEKNGQTYRDWEEKMEMGEDWSILDEDLMFTGTSNYLQQDQAMKLVEKIKNRIRYRY